LEENSFYLSQIAKLYYIDKVKQNEIARRFQITPMMVSRSLNEAEQKGLVVFHVKMPWGINTELGKAVMDKYNLRECIVLDVKEKNEIPVTLGGYLAEYFMSILKPNSIVGLSWGYTISKFVEALAYSNVENCQLIQLTGAFLDKNYFVTPTHIVQEVSKKLNARIYSLNAPLYAATAEMQEQFSNDPTNKIIHQMAEESDINIFGVSELSEEATTFQTGIVNKNDFDELKNLGAIGDCAGTFIDKDGDIIKWSKSNLYTGIYLNRIQKAKNVICVAGEPEKAEVIKAVVQKKYINILMTTKQVALDLLK